MRPNKKQRLRAIFDPPGTAPPAHIPVQITFRHMPASPAVSARVDDEAQKLQRYFDRITRCRVVIVAPHRHHRLGQHYSVHVELSVPKERLVITNEPAARPRLITQARLDKRSEFDAAHKDIYVVIREVFDATRRRLEDYVRRLRGDVKRHATAAAPEPLSE